MTYQLTLDQLRERSRKMNELFKTLEEKFDARFYYGKYRRTLVYIPPKNPTDFCTHIGYIETGYPELVKYTPLDSKYAI